MRALLPLSCVLLLAACGGSSSGGAASSDPTPPPAATTCVELHTAPAGFHIQKRDDGTEITLENCDETEKINIRNGQISKAADNNADAVDIRYGQFTGFMTGIGDFDEGKMSFYVLFPGVVEDGRRQNIHAGLWGTPQPFKNRLVRHWWAAEGVHPEIYLRETRDLAFDPAKTYRFDINWNATDVTVQICEGANNAEVAALNVCSRTNRAIWGAPMKKMSDQQFLFGNKILKGYSFGNSVKLKGVRFTVFEAD
ncbi:MAG: hypothetical protein HQK87_04850 [Nitrospinae bacterium]|nr:hypothetical protein [Nitrospinota bacterium]